MDISLQLNLNQLSTGLTAASNSLGLQVNQVFNAQVVETQLALNSFSLSVAGNTLQVQSQQAVNLQVGQSLQLQVVKLSPLPEFTILASGSGSASQLSLSQTDAVTLTLTNVIPPSVQSLSESLLTTSQGTQALNQSGLQLNQIIDATVLNTSGSGTMATLNLNGGKGIQVQLPPNLTMQPGQTLQLQVVKLQPQPEFNLLTPVGNTSTAQQSNTQPVKLLEVPVSLQGMNGLVADQKLSAMVVTRAGNQITLQINGQQTVDGLAKPTDLRVTLDSRQLKLIGDGVTHANNTLANLLKPGTQIDLQLLSAGKLPVFAISLPENQEGLSPEKVNTLLKNLLPIQNSPTELLTFLGQTLAILKLNPSVAEALTQLAEQILAHIPEQSQLQQPEKLHDSIRQSGLFLESKLANLLASSNNSNLTADLKANLLKFSQALNLQLSVDTLTLDTHNLLNELLQKTNAGLAKITLDQFNAINVVEDSPKQAWSLELPYFYQHTAHSLHIEIQQDKQRSNNGDEPAKQKNWAVSITITPPELGTIYCNISCYDGVINTRFWSHAPEIVEKINSHLNYLQQQLEQKGLKTGFMEAHQGKPAKQDVSIKSLANLLNEKV
ncbi:flagellar hook-length control protein FliK [Methylomonas sp. AM2-LC]|uniref:flagellar hook-length control protein FliK n=1 Tax=Methylomonas sp. AM2-LC TaxID=3153301 RepID=UPI003265DC2A